MGWEGLVPEIDMPNEDLPQTGHFIHMNKLLEASRRACSKFANNAGIAEKALRDTAADRDRWKSRALEAEAKLASLGYAEERARHDQN